MIAQAKQRRWYDKDPLLSMAMKTLEKSSDENQIRLAMHLIKVINEHNIEVDAASPSEPQDAYDLDEVAATRRKRWYDIDRNLRTSIEMLRCCPLDTQKLIAREMAQMLNDYMEDDEEKDDN